jgi:sugar/nucleoside kinase (ribokinase family)
MNPSERRGIACGGNWIIDRVKSVDHYPAENSVADVLDASLGGGGCAHNVALNLARFDPGLPVYAAGVIGADPDGDWLLEECRRHPNVDTAWLARTDRARTSTTDVFSVRATGNRTFFHDRGANRLFGPDAVDPGRLGARIFHLGYLLLLDAMDRPDPDYGRVSARFLAGLQARGILTSIDLVSADVPDFSDVVSPALRYADFCIINDFEAERLTGVPVRGPGGVSRGALGRVAEAVFARGVRRLVAVHFPEGAFAVPRGGKGIYQPSLDLPPGFIVGSTGAGDSFCAGMLYGLHEGWDLGACLEFAACAGAQNLRDLTTVGSITEWRETLRLKERYPYRKDGGPDAGPASPQVERKTG